MEYKRKIRSKWPLVDAQVIRFNHIVHELPQIDAFLRKLKVDKITYRQDIHFQEIMPVRQTRNGVCFWLYLGMLIRPDGRVYPCCGRGFGRFSYGNILHQSISEIQNNKYYRFSRSLFTQHFPTVYDDEMKNIPCLSCKQFRIRAKAADLRRSISQPENYGAETVIKRKWITDSAQFRSMKRHASIENIFFMAF